MKDLSTLALVGRERGTELRLDGVPLKGLVNYTICGDKSPPGAVLVTAQFYAKPAGPAAEQK